MTRATLSDVLRPAGERGYAVPGFVCLGWEDSRAFVTAATRLIQTTLAQITK